MKEKIYLMPFADPTELVRSMARRGVCMAGLRIVGSLELARIGLTDSGIAIRGRLLSGRSQTAAVARIMKNIEFFKPAAYTDARLLSAALDKLRMAADGDTLRKRLSQGLFAEKNRALLQALDEYEALLEESGLTDGVSVIRLAAEHCRPLDENKYELAEVEGYPLTPLERQLLDRLSGERAAKLTLGELYRADAESKAELVVTEAYGASNEVSDIVNTIFEERLPLDKCTVAVTDAAKYSQLFAEICGLHGIPLTLGCGTLLTSTYPAKLLRLCHRWLTAGSCGAVESCGVGLRRER